MHYIFRSRLKGRRDLRELGRYFKQSLGCLVWIELYQLKQARKARRWYSYLQIWNYQWLTHPLTTQWNIIAMTRVWPECDQCDLNVWMMKCQRLVCSTALLITCTIQPIQYLKHENNNILGALFFIRLDDHWPEPGWVGDKILWQEYSSRGQVGISPQCQMKGDSICSQNSYTELT